MTEIEKIAEQIREEADTKKRKRDTNSQEQQSEAPNNITRTTYRFSNDA